jgi:catalase
LNTWQKSADTFLQKKYLAQVYNIAVDYAQNIYEALPKKEFKFSEVEELSKTAQEWYKEPKFRPSQGERLTGYAPPVSIYNV